MLEFCFYHLSVDPFVCVGTIATYHVSFCINKGICNVVSADIGLLVLFHFLWLVADWIEMRTTLRSIVQEPYTHFYKVD